MNAVVEYTESESNFPAAPANPNNPFARSAIATRSTNNAIADAGQQREIAEVQAAMIIAKKFPRNPIAAMDSILQACTRPSLAEGALYSYSRGGSEVTGPSIRLAEVAAQSWGNVQFGIRELEQRNGESTVEAFAWDVETNTRQVKVFQVAHKRYTRSGSKKLEDPRDIYEMVANQGARRLRACILGVIPGDVIEAAVKQCEQTLKSSADTSPEGLKKLLAAFEPFGVTQAQIEKRCQCRLEAIRPAQVVHLKKVYASLRDGMSAASDWFESTAEGAVAGGDLQGLEAELLGKKAKPGNRKDDSPPVTFDEVKAAMEAAADADALDNAYDMANLIPAITDAERKELAGVWEQRKAALG